MGKTFGCSIIPAVVYPYCEVLFLSKETENNIFFVLFWCTKSLCCAGAVTPCLALSWLISITLLGSVAEFDAYYFLEFLKLVGWLGTRSQGARLSSLHIFRKVLLCPGTTCLIWSILIDNSSTDVLILNPDGGTQLRPVTNSLGQGLQGCVFVDLCVDNEPFLSIIQLTKETELWIDMPRMVASLVVILYCLGWCLWHH
ncbi:hypothetical protein P8452_26871 [Trifolium repens]|nr:hypothetical protein P8452_26871 [Trifolium repens]